MAHALTFSNTMSALDFFIEWPAYDHAARLIVQRHTEIDGNAYYLLTPAARALEIPNLARLMRVSSSKVLDPNTPNKEEIRSPESTGRACHQGHPPRDPQAVFGRGEDPHCSRGPPRTEGEKAGDPACRYPRRAAP